MPEFRQLYTAGFKTKVVIEAIQWKKTDLLVLPALLLNRFFDMFGIYPYSTKNPNSVKELILDGNMAASKFNELL